MTPEPVRVYCVLHLRDMRQSDDPCWLCDGGGKISLAFACPRCHGTGHAYECPDCLEAARAAILARRRGGARGPRRAGEP